MGQPHRSREAEATDMNQQSRLTGSVSGNQAKRTVLGDLFGRLVLLIEASVPLLN